MMLPFRWAIHYSRNNKLSGIKTKAYSSLLRFYMRQMAYVIACMLHMCCYIARIVL